MLPSSQTRRICKNFWRYVLFIHHLYEWQRGRGNKMFSGTSIPGIISLFLHRIHSNFLIDNGNLKPRQPVKWTGKHSRLPNLATRPQNIFRALVWWSNNVWIKNIKCAIIPTILVGLLHAKGTLIKKHDITRVFDL
jgi:hypothetical protein